MRLYGKHLVFDGISFHFARLLCDAASGGQVIVSHECAIALEGNLLKCVVEPVVVQFMGEFVPPAGRGLHSFTFRLNVSALYWIG